MNKIAYGISLFVLCIGCTKQQYGKLPLHIKDLKNLTVYPADAQPEYKVMFMRDETYSSTKNMLIGRFGEVAVDDLGRVFIEDEQQLTIDVFEPDGRFIMYLGSEGRGPGEFTSIRGMQIRNDLLFVYDGRQQRAVVFPLDSLGINYTVNIADNRHDFKDLRGADVIGYYVRKDSTFLIKFMERSNSGNRGSWTTYVRGSLYCLLDKNGQIKSGKLLEAKSSIISLVPWPPPHPRIQVKMHLRLYPKSLTVLLKDNHILWAWQTDFLIKIYSSNGKYQRAFYYPYKRVPLTLKSASDGGVPDYILKNMHSMELPKTWPALNDMKIDDLNHLWISTIVKNMKVYQWWVLNQNGKLLARFIWPRNKPIKVIKNGYIYTQETDTTGIPEIVRYRIKMNPS